MAQDSLIQKITETIISNCCNKKNIYICEDDIENHCRIHENKKECFIKVKENLESLDVKITTWD